MNKIVEKIIEDNMKPVWSFGSPLDYKPRMKAEYEYDFVRILKELRSQAMYTSTPQIANLIIEALGEEVAADVAIYLTK
jgi:hypothetical protein